MQNRSNYEIQQLNYTFPQDTRVQMTDYTQTYEQRSVLHRHSCLEIGRCFSGSSTVYLDGAIYPFSAGSVMVILPGCIHDSHILMNDPSETPSRWRYLFWNPDAPGLRFLHSSLSTHDADLTALFDLMAAERFPPGRTAGRMRWTG